MPSHCLTFENGELTIRRYWEPVFEPDENVTLEELTDKIDDAMQASIKRHKISDVEVGSFLSSGVDSSYVAACFKGDKTFTVGFDYAKYNEIDYAKSLSEKIKIDNYSKLISTDEYWDIIPTVQYHMDEPLADPSAIALYFVSQTAAKHVKVSLSGEGADEFFGGYNIYREPFSLRPITRLPKGLRKALGACAAAIPFKIKGKNYLIRGSKDVEERFIGNAFLFNEKEREKLLKNPTGKYNHTELTKPYYDKVKNLDDTTKMQYIDIHFWLIGDILLKADKMSMAHSLEVRVPFLDRDVFGGCKKKCLSNIRLQRKTPSLQCVRLPHRYLPDIGCRKEKARLPCSHQNMVKRGQVLQHRKGRPFTSPAAAEFFNVDEIVKLLDDQQKRQKRQQP